MLRLIIYKYVAFLSHSRFFFCFASGKRERDRERKRDRERELFLKGMGFKNKQVHLFLI
jgi:hypothetical protein